jgi:hypothetical protein
MITPLAIGQIYTESVSPYCRNNRIEIIRLDGEYVHYTASEGRISSYRVARNRFEGLVKGGVFVPSPIMSRTELQSKTICKLESENLALREQLEKLKRQMLFIAERIKL